MTINVAEIFEKSRDVSNLGGFADVMRSMEKVPHTLRSLSDLVTSTRKKDPTLLEGAGSDTDTARVNGFSVSPNLLFIKEGLNLRPVDPDRAIMFKHAYIERPASVPAIRVKVEVVEGITRLKVVDGHHRYVGLMLAIAEGHNFQKLIVEEFTGGADEEVFNIMESANAKPLEFIERAEGFKRLVGMGHEEKAIAVRLHVSITTVRRSLLLANADHQIKLLVRDGVISGDMAASVIEECQGTSRDPFQELVTAQKQAAKQGKTRVTGKFIKSTKKVSLKPKQIRQTFAALMPTLDQLRAQIPPAPSGDHEDQVEIDETVPADVTLTLTPEQARTLMESLANLEAAAAAATAAEEEGDDDQADTDADKESSNQNGAENENPDDEA